jgi:5-methylcytosine-specific restriction endonuclease McrA
MLAHLSGPDRSRPWPPKHSFFSGLRGAGGNRTWTFLKKPPVHRKNHYTGNLLGGILWVIMDRPICKESGCENLAESYGRREPVHYRSLCSRHRRHRNGRLTGWERKMLKIRLEMEKRERSGCDKCGTTGPKGFLELHHKEDGHRNNEMENLTILCPNCHRLADLENASKKNGCITESGRVQHLFDGQ